MEKVKVSVIVPVYNVYDYLDKCLDSLKKQTLKDIEVIIVNDGSPDNSQEIIDKYVKENDNFFGYLKDNGGLSDARNYGIKKAHGEYIAFLDSDDYVLFDMYEKMYNKAITNNYDMVVCDLNYIYDDKVKRASCNVSRDTNNVKDVMLNIYPVAWNKIFKRELFDNNVYFKKGVWFEDVEFIYRMLPYVKKIGVVHEPFNQYIQRDGSIMKTINKKIYDYIDNLNSIVNFYQERKFYNVYYKELEYIYVRYIYATFIKSAMGFVDKKDYQEAVDMAIQNVKEHFPKYRKNKYFYHSLKGLYLLIFNKTIALILYKIRRCL